MGDSESRYSISVAVLPALFSKRPNASPFKRKLNDVWPDESIQSAPHYGVNYHFVRHFILPNKLKKTLHWAFLLQTDL